MMLTVGLGLMMSDSLQLILYLMVEVAETVLLQTMLIDDMMIAVVPWVPVIAMLMMYLLVRM